MNYILAVLGLGAIIIVHELGHFIMAKINGVKVFEFSIGFGPKIISHKGKETEYSISLLPVGGYVQMYGMTEDEEDDGEGKIEEDVERKFISKKPLQRLSIIIAGPLMNIVLAIFLFGTIYSNFGYAETSLGQISENSAAMETGIQSGDKVTKINGSNIYTADDISIDLAQSQSEALKGIVENNDYKGDDNKLSIDKIPDGIKGSPVTLQYERNGSLMETILTPKFDKEKLQFFIGVGFNIVENPNLTQIIKHSFNETRSLITQNYKAIVKLASGKGNFKTDIGGPVSIVQVASGAAEAGVWALVRLVAIMSIGVGIFNLLPLPVLDGGNSILILIELITRRKVPTKVVNVLNTVGVVFLFGLMLVVTVKDILFPIK
ncbi:RIP metalloprotease RseP [Clostridium sp. HBUAS56017]|uniref:RIP metalloprotease RseP n=1 Tax=Clostridium sp. HBUAS56017 TaxID=2571128 RepID=UPI001178B8D0|nr:RIP metalloprotease RseP [Clostridium sp. HBUAS56017]